MRARVQDLARTLEYVGTIKALDEALVYPKVSGKIIEKLKDEGDAVTKADVLMYIDRDEVGMKYEKAPVESPVTGVVGRIYVDRGAHVTTQTPLALVVAMQTMKIMLDIPERYVPQLKLGQEARVSVDAYPQESFTGTIAAISPVVNLENRAIPVEIRIPNPDGRLKSGMFARASLMLEEHSNVVTVMKESLIGRDPQAYVYVIENNRAVSRKVTLGLIQGNWCEVVEGVRAEDAVVVMGQQRLYENAPVMTEDSQEQAQ
jgi:RND family efflux transporter MFP subunit